jgi:hypothetical protein
MRFAAADATGNGDALAALFARALKMSRADSNLIPRLPPLPIPRLRSPGGMPGKRAQMASRSLKVVDIRPPGRIGGAIGGVGVVPRAIDRGRGEGGVASGGAQVSLRTSHEGEGAHDEFS